MRKPQKKDIQNEKSKTAKAKKKIEMKIYRCRFVLMPETECVRNVVARTITKQTCCQHATPFVQRVF